MNFTTTECRAIEQASADALNLLMAHLHAFHECRKQLERVEDLVNGDATHHASPANDALRLIDKAKNDLDVALALVVGVRLKEIKGQM
jgi:prephenate dehydratase